eukprot:6199350-Pleurochrysis_carterae.AAC.5
MRRLWPTASHSPTLSSAFISAPAYSGVPLLVSPPSPLRAPCFRRATPRPRPCRDRPGSIASASALEDALKRSA